MTVGNNFLYTIYKTVVYTVAHKVLLFDYSPSIFKHYLSLILAIGGKKQMVQV